MFQQKILDHGTDSVILRKTLMQAKVMFRKEFLSIDVERAMELSLEAVSEFASMQEACDAFNSAEQAAINKVEAFARRGSSQTVPSVGNVRNYCKTYFQKADHFVITLLSIVRLFYPELKTGKWDDLESLVKSSYGKADPFCKVLDIAVPWLRLIRNARDCLEHNRPDVVTRDFEPELDGSIAPPTIELKFRGSTIDRCRISTFMQQAATMLLDSFEMIAVHMSSKRSQPFAGMPLVVGVLPDDVQAAWHVRFAYGMCDQNGHFVPCG